MTTVLTIIIIISLTTVVLCGILSVTGLLRPEKWVRRVRKVHYGVCLNDYLSAIKPDTALLDELGNRIDRNLAGETIDELYTLFSGYRPARLAEIEVRYGLRRHFTHRAIAERGNRRIEALRILCHLTPDASTVERLATIAGRSAEADLWLLVLRITSRPRSALSLIEACSRRFSGRRLDLLADEIIRRRIPLDWRRAIASPDANLCRTGIRLVGAVAIAEAEEPLIAVLSRNDTDTIVEALRVIVDMRLPLTDRRIVSAVGKLDRTQRKALYRQMLREGYSIGSLGMLIGFERSLTTPLEEYVTAVANSYKHSLQ